MPIELQLCFEEGFMESKKLVQFLNINKVTFVHRKVGGGGVTNVYNGIKQPSQMI